ncbi:MAG: hypothetical protein O9264_06215 [Leptospira sp.]|nr:hypothetical protein [Leptospira sp.]
MHSATFEKSWIKGPYFDLAFIFGIVLLAGLMSGITVFWPLLFIPVLTVHSWLFGYEHLWATFTKLIAHPDDRKRHRTLIFIAPGFVLIGIVSVGYTFELRGLYVLYFFGQFFHTVRQSWGIAQTYRRTAGGIKWDPIRLSEITLWSVPIWGLLHRCAQQPEEFLFQNFWLPTVPQTVVYIFGSASCLLWSYWIFTRVAAFKRGEFAVGHTLYMLSHFAVYFFSYILIEELCSGWLLVNVWHNVQYIAFVWVYNRKRFVNGRDAKAPLLSWLSQAGSLRAIFYILATIAFALPFYYLLPQLGLTLDTIFKAVAVPIAVILAMSLTFHHYIVDGIIWKSQNDQSMKEMFEPKGASMIKKTQFEEA